MGAVENIVNSDKVNYINIYLILLSCVIAFFAPFELFLFSYAVLGPLHYLTEISWLHERGYFLQHKFDFVFLVVCCVALFLLVYIAPAVKLLDKSLSFHSSAAVIYIAFMASLVMVLLKGWAGRVIAFIFVLASASIIKRPEAALLFSLFLPTLVHVSLFTGMFMLYGALKNRRRSEYLSALTFFTTPFLFAYITPEVNQLSPYVQTHYKMFHNVNVEVMRLFDEAIFSIYNPSIDAVYKSALGGAVMRFIAFAYTYHYLNWFSKTSVIKWHHVSKVRLMVIGILWMAAVSLYFYSYTLGVSVLFLLSFLHVFLEFPLNHVTLINIFKELYALCSTVLRGKTYG